MLNTGKLQAGQIIRDGGTLWRVNHVSECRAFITPLRKKDLKSNENAEHSTSGGVNISPTSMVEIIDDLETTQTLMEIEEAEREAREARRAIADQEREAAQAKPVKVEKPAAPKAPRGPRTVAGGWRVAEGVQPRPKDGTLGAAVYDYVLANAGQTTQQIVDALTAAGVTGALAAAVSRFNQAGVFVKE